MADVNGQLKTMDEVKEVSSARIAAPITQQPVASKSLLEENATEKLLVTSAMGFKPQAVICPSCNNEITTKTKIEPNSKTHCSAFVMGLLSCGLCCWVPYCLDTCQSTHHYCPNCKNFIGSDSSWLQKEHNEEDNCTNCITCMDCVTDCLLCWPDSCNCIPICSCCASECGPCGLCCEDCDKCCDTCCCDGCCDDCGDCGDCSCDGCDL